MYNVDVHPDVYAEMEHSRAWYEERAEALGSDHPNHCRDASSSPPGLLARESPVLERRAHGAVNRVDGGFSPPAARKVKAGFGLNRTQYLYADSGMDHRRHADFVYRSGLFELDKPDAQVRYPILELWRFENINNTKRIVDISNMVSRYFERVTHTKQRGARL